MSLAGKPLPVYGDGQQIRDWLYVKDHCSAIRRVLEAGRVGEVYNIGGCNENPNIEIVHTVCALLDELSPRTDGRSYRGQIVYVPDRPGQSFSLVAPAHACTPQRWRSASSYCQCSISR